MIDDQIYREQLLELYKNPQNRGTVIEPDIDYYDNNPLCGDEIRLTAKVQEDKISDVKFSGKGCAISQASASLLTEAAKNKTISDILKMDRDQMTKLLGVQVSVSRVKCMMLALVTLKKGIVKWSDEHA